MVGRGRSVAPVIVAPVDGRTRRLVERIAGVPPFLRDRLVDDGGWRAGAEHRRVHRGDERLTASIG